MCNFVQGVAILLCLQSFTVISVERGASDHTSRYVGVLLLASGAALRNAAIRTLGVDFGDAFSPTSPRRVTEGPYRFMRHPAELGLLMIVAGYGTMLSGWCPLTFGLFALLAAGARVRISWEEEAFAGLASSESSDRCSDPLAPPVAEA